MKYVDYECQNTARWTRLFQYLRKKEVMIVVIPCYWFPCLAYSVVVMQCCVKLSLSPLSSNLFSFARDVHSILHLFYTFAYRFLKELNLHESKVKHRGHHWINCFPRPSTSLESLNFACLDGSVNPHALEELVARSPNLKSLRLNRSVPFDVLVRILSRTCKLEDLGTGSFLRGYNAGAFGSLFIAIGRCTSLKSLSGFWDAPGFLLPAIYSVCRNLTCLNLSYARDTQSADLINVIRNCTKLRLLWVRFYLCS
jgi:hypothetical protein